MYKEKHYLFPFGDVAPGSRIVIYGAAQLGQVFRAQLQQTHYAAVAAFVDREAARYQELDLPVVTPEHLAELTYDYVVIAILSPAVSLQVAEFLRVSCGIPAEKIVPALDCALRPPQEVVPLSSMLYPAAGFAYEKTGVSVALRVGEGLGDIIMAKRFIEALLPQLPSACRIDLYGKVEFIQAVCGSAGWLHNAFAPGKLYLAQKEHYTLALTVSYILTVDHCNFASLQQAAPEFVPQIRELMQATQRDGLSSAHPTDNAVRFLQTKVLGKNAYTVHDYGKIKITDSHTSIPLLPAAVERFRQLDLGERYVTVNYGWGALPAGSKTHAKAWLPRYYTRLAAILHEHFPAVRVVQLGTAHSLRLSGMDAYVLGESLEVVKYVLLHACLHIDCEGGLVHLATQLGTKCAVMFGPTPSWYFGYAQNINIVSPVCTPCCYLQEDFSSCYRGLAEPECMCALTPALVWSRIESYLRQKLAKAAREVEPC